MAGIKLPEIIWREHVTKKLWVLGPTVFYLQQIAQF